VDRPDFAALLEDFEQLLVQDTDYIDLNQFPEHAYYNEVGLSDEKV
jgi:fibroblast growth factor receptor 1